MRSKLAATTAFTPNNRVPFAAQSRLEPVPYSVPAKITSGIFVSAILHRRVENRHLFAARLDEWSLHLPSRAPSDS